MTMEGDSVSATCNDCTVCASQNYIVACVAVTMQQAPSAHKMAAKCGVGVEGSRFGVSS